MQAAPVNEPRTGESSEEDTAANEALAILRRYDRPEDTASQLEFLRQLLPDPNRKQVIARLIHALGHDKFLVRDDAYHRILAIGLESQPQLVEATASEDPEVRLRAQRLLEALGSGPELAKREALTRAAFALLRHHREAQAVPVVLAVAGQTTEPHLYAAASETVWACSDASHAALLQAAMASGNARKQAIALVALEVALGDQAIEIVAPFLRSDLEMLRLAAARALVDRQPRVIAPVLIELLSSEDPEIYAQAHALLKTMFNRDLEADDERSLADVWRGWADQHLQTATVVPLRAARLDLSHGRGFLEETFTIAAKDVTRGYRRFSYENDLPTKAGVSDGVLRLEGDHPEADQRLYITSKTMTGRSEWPRVVEVHAELTGEAAGSGGYHVGISVGRLKALFHPAYSGGGFRIETVDDHDYLVNNTNLGFTPRPGVFHELIMTVTRTPTGAAVEVEVIQGEPPRTRFRNSYSFTEEQLGEFNRVGLERSGRTGGAAQFNRVSIRLKQ